MWYRFTRLIVVFPNFSDKMGLRSGLWKEILTLGFRTIVGCSSAMAYGEKMLLLAPGSYCYRYGITGIGKRIH